jgi:hypothetical protein
MTPSGPDTHRQTSHEADPDRREHHHRRAAGATPTPADRRASTTPHGCRRHQRPALHTYLTMPTSPPCAAGKHQQALPRLGPGHRLGRDVPALNHGHGHHSDDSHGLHGRARRRHRVHQSDPRARHPELRLRPQPRRRHLFYLSYQPSRKARPRVQPRRLNISQAGVASLSISIRSASRARTAKM